MHNVVRAIDDGTCWIIDGEDSSPVGTVTLDQSADPNLWQPEDIPDDALYVHRLVVGLEFRSAEIGSAALDWASTKAHSLGKSWLRLDVWTNNTRLRQYYLDRGFTLVRIVPDLKYGALFQREAGVLLGRGPTITEHEAPGQ
jgi:GNAT superfamily N-acetyltransferase